MNRGGLHWSRSLRFRLLAVTVAGVAVAVVLAGFVVGVACSLIAATIFG